MHYHATALTNIHASAQAYCVHNITACTYAITIVPMPCAMDGEEWVDLFDDDSNDEDSRAESCDTDTALSQIEPSSSGTDSAPAPKRKKKSLSKWQKQQVLGAVEQLDKTRVSENISAIIMKQLHMQVYFERAVFPISHHHSQGCFHSHL